MRRIVVVVAVLLGCASIAHAQQQKPPIGPFVIDVRGFYSGLGQDPVTAQGLGVTAALLPGRSPGGVIGIHVYPLRLANMAFGIGAEGVLARGHAQERDDTTGDPVGAPITQRFQGLAPQISINFGHRDGWSYLSAGMGPLSFASYAGDAAPTDPPPRKMTINMGAGARWFNSAHVAFCFDIRFYLTRPEDATAFYPARQRTRLMVMSAGIALK